MSAIGITPTIGVLLEAGSVHVGVTASTKADLLDFLVDSLEGCEGIDDLPAVRDSIFDRESALSTGVGDGVALPHAKTPGASKTLAVFATTSDPIEFESFDNRPVRLVFMLIGPALAAQQHIRILGRVSRLLQREQVRMDLIAARTAPEIIDILLAAEEEILTH